MIWLSRLRAAGTDQLRVPGVIETPMMGAGRLLDKAEAQAMLRGVMPIGRMGTAEEVAGAILFSPPKIPLCVGERC